MSSVSKVSFFNFSDYQFQDIQASYFSRCERRERVFIKDKREGNATGSVSQMVYHQMSKMRRKNYYERKRHEAIQKYEIYHYADATKMNIGKKVGKEKAVSMGLQVDEIAKRQLERVGKEQFQGICASLKKEVNILLKKEEITLYCERRKSSFANLGISAAHLDKTAEKYRKMVDNGCEHGKIDAALKSEIDKLLQEALFSTFLLAGSTSDKDQKESNDSK